MYCKINAFPYLELETDVAFTLFVLVSSDLCVREYVILADLQAASLLG